MVDLKTTLYLSEDEVTKRVLPLTVAEQVEVPDISGNSSDVKAEIEQLRQSKLDAPVSAGQPGQVLQCDNAGAPVWAESPKELPEISSSEGGRVLTIKGDVSGIEWAAIPSDLPDVSSAAAGQVLMVNSTASGAEWANAPSFVSNSLNGLTMKSYELILENEATGTNTILVSIDRSALLESIASQNSISSSSVKQISGIRLVGSFTGSSTGTVMDINSSFYTDGPDDRAELLLLAKFSSGDLSETNLTDVMSSASVSYKAIIQN